MCMLRESLRGGGGESVFGYKSYFFVDNFVKHIVNSLPIAALCDVINNTTLRSMEIFPSKPRTRCDVAPQMTHRMQRIYRVL